MSKHSKAAKLPPIDQAGVERAQRRYGRPSGR